MDTSLGVINEAFADEETIQDGVKVKGFDEKCKQITRIDDNTVELFDNRTRNIGEDGLHGNYNIKDTITSDFETATSRTAVGNHFVTQISIPDSNFTVKVVNNSFIDNPVSNTADSDSEEDTIETVADLTKFNTADLVKTVKELTKTDDKEKFKNEIDEKKLVAEEDTIGEETEGQDFSIRFSGAAFRSFNEKKMKKSWRRRSLGEELKSFCQLKESTPDLNRSQYSLVSCGELTAGAVQLWLGLPEEVKYDPALAPFRQLYEKEQAKDSILKKNSKARLPLVNSAPHLNNNFHVAAEDISFIDGKGKEIDTQTDEKQAALDSAGSQKKTGKFARARHLTKITLLLACWVFFTAVFLMYNEKEESVMNSSVAPGETKNYTLQSGLSSKISVLVKLSGPFLSEQAEGRFSSIKFRQAQKIEVWLERWPKDGNRTVDNSTGRQLPEYWPIILQDSSDLDFNVGEERTKVLNLEFNNTEDAEFVLLLRSSANGTVPFKMSYSMDPLDLSTGVIYAVLLLCGLYILIIFEVLNRTLAAVLISTTALAALAISGERPSVQEIISWLDVETLLLLFSMMLLVAIMAETGMFDFLAVYTFEVTKGKLWPLISLLCAITAVLSTFLDNVTTVLLMTPVTIRLCEVMDLDPIPILMSMVLYSNIGGTATPVGDPPNVIIASNKAVIQAGINFTNFTLHMTIGIFLVCLQTYAQLRFMFRDTNKMRICVPRDIQELRHQLSIWRRAADSLPHLSKDQLIVRERLERKMRKLQAQLDTMVKESKKRACPKHTFESTLGELKDKYKIRDKALLVKASVAISFVVAVFFLHSIPELNRVSLGWTALLGAILLLILADREDLEPILHRVEWSTLLFFAALFVLMEALSKLGLIVFIGGLTESLILKVDESGRLAVAIVLMLWVSGITSAFVDNIPLTTMMVRVVTSLGTNPNLGLPMAPLIWALSFGACLGGNGTLIGASANVVCAGVAEQHGYKFTFVQFFKIGFPIMIGHLIVATGYLLLCHCVFTWH